MHRIFASVTCDILQALDIFQWIAELPETPSFHVQDETISPTDWVTISADFPAEGPYAIRPTEALKRSMAQPGSFLESWTKFKLDLASMPSVTAKTGRQQKPVQEVGGPVSLLSMAMPVKHIALTMEAFQGILATACPQAAPLAPQLSKVAASEFVYLWAMGANTEFIGVDFNAFGMVRMQLEGHRTLMCFCAEAVCDVLSLGSTATVDDILGSMKKKLKKGCHSGPLRAQGCLSHGRPAAHYRGDARGLDRGGEDRRLSGHGHQAHGDARHGGSHLDCQVVGGPQGEPSESECHSECFDWRGAGMYDKRPAGDLSNGTPACAWGDLGAEGQSRGQKTHRKDVVIDWRHDFHRWGCACNHHAIVYSRFLKCSRAACELLVVSRVETCEHF